MKFLCSILLACLLFVQSDTAIVDTNHYTPIKCEGPIDDAFIAGLGQYVDLQEDVFKDYYSDNNSLEDKKEKIILQSGLDVNFFFRNGSLLFGDPVTAYLNKIKDELLKNDKVLAQKIKIYTLKTSDVNAFTTLNGNIYFTLGLISRSNSEAELAFILAHEIAHYCLNHIIGGLTTNAEIEKMTKERKKLTFDDIVKFKFQRSHVQEFEADSLGFIIYEKSAYNAKEMLEAMNTLAYAHMPMGRCDFNQQCFNEAYLNVPSCFFKEEIKEAKSTENGKDQYSTHPDIEKRKDKIAFFLNHTKPEPDGARFISSKEEFENIKQIAALESLQRLLLDRHYADVIYETDCILQKYPDSEFLHVIFAKALYAASIYKNSNYYHYTARPYSTIEGSPQQVHYLLKHLSAVQLNTIAINHMYALKKKYPANKVFPQLETKLIEALVLKHKLNLASFYSKEKSKTEFDTRYHIEPAANISKLDLRQQYKDFYLLAFADIKDDKLIVGKFAEAEELAQKAEALKNMSFKELEQKERDAKKDGFGIRADSILIFDPEYFAVNKTDKKVIQSNENRKVQLLALLRLRLKEINKKIDIVSVSELTSKDTPKYNEYVTAATWIKERENQLDKLGILPLTAENFKASPLLSQYKFICTIDVVMSGGSRVYYECKLFNIETGECSYQGFKRVDDDETINKLTKFILTDINNIIN